MNAGGMVVLALVLGTAGCGKFVPVTKPFAEERASLSGGFGGRLVLVDGAGLEMRGGKVLGDWVCGKPSGRPGLGEYCIEADRVATIEQSEWRAGPADWIGQVITVVIMWPAMAAFVYSDHENDREAKASAEQAVRDRSAAEARAAARGEVLPPLPTPESRMRKQAFGSLAQCKGLDRAERKHADGQGLAAQVLRDQTDCLGPAIEWFSANGDVASARRLTFVHLARWRYEDLVCRGTDVGLRAPEKEIIAGAPTTWMNEYRATVTDRRTYDYDISDPCHVPEGAVSSPAPSKAAAKGLVASSFPLTEDPGLASTMASAKF